MARRAAITLVSQTVYRFGAVIEVPPISVWRIRLPIMPIRRLTEDKRAQDEMNKFNRDLGYMKKDIEHSKEYEKKQEQSINKLAHELGETRSDIKIVRTDIKHLEQILEKDIKEVKTEMKGMERLINLDMEHLKDSVQTVKDSVQTVNDSVQTVKDSVQTVKDSVQTVKDSVQTVKDSVQTVQTELSKNKGHLEDSVKVMRAQISEDMENLLERGKHQWQNNVLQLAAAVLSIFGVGIVYKYKLR